MKNSTLVVITSALFVSTKGEMLASPSVDRMARLQKSLDGLKAVGFSHFVLLDNTVPTSFNSHSLPISIANLIPSGIELPTNEFFLNGPSRLEAVLMGQAIPDMQQRLKDFKFVLKISAGYRVRNLESILAKFTEGAVFRMGNPLRREIKFCLSSFYILPAKHFLSLAVYVNTQLDNMSNLKPLEYHLHNYVQSVEHKLVALPYPRLDADFLSSKTSSKDFNYRLKEQVFIFLSKLGLYAYIVK